ncbi:TRAP transporter substrate-binding protein [Chloroflexota bacterium]
MFNNRKIKWLILVGTLALFIALVTVSCTPAPSPAPAPAPAPVPAPAPTPKYTWKIASTFPGVASMPMSGEVFADLVEQRTNGEVKFERFWGGTLGSIIESLEAVGAGQLDMHHLFPYGRLHPALDLSSIPFAATTDEEVDKLFYGDGIINQTLMRVWEKIGIKVIYNTHSGFHDLWNSVRAIRSPDDMADLKLRSMPGPLFLEMFERLGVLATPIAFQEVYDSLRTGTVDGLSVPAISGLELKFNEVTGYITDYHLAYTMPGFGMNLALFNSLPGDLQKIILDAGIVAENYNQNIERRGTIEAYKYLKDFGIEVIRLTPAERQVFIDLIKPEELWDEFLAPILDETFPGENLMAQIKAEVARVRAE